LASLFVPLMFAALHNHPLACVIYDERVYLDYVKSV